MQLGLADVIAAPLSDTRSQLLITHTYAAMMPARNDDVDALRLASMIAVRVLRYAYFDRAPLLKQSAFRAGWASLGPVFQSRDRQRCRSLRQVHLQRNRKLVHGAFKGDTAHRRRGRY